MAYIADKRIQTTNGNVTSYTVELPAHVSGQYLLIIMNYGVNATITPPSSPWTTLTNGGANNRLVVVWLKATSSTTTNPTFTTSNDDAFTSVAYTIEDADGTTFVDTSSFTTMSSASTSGTLDSITTTTDGCLIFSIMAVGTADIFAWPVAHREFLDADLDEGSTQLIVTHTGQVSSGVVASQTIQIPTTARFRFGRIAIRNASGGSTEPIIDGGVNMIKRMGAVDNLSSVVNLSTRQSTIDGDSVLAVTSLTIANDGGLSGMGYTNSTEITITGNPTAGNYFGFAWSTGGVDLSGVFTADLGADLAAYVTRDTYGMYVEDSAANWAYLQLPYQTYLTLFTVLDDLPSIDGSGTVDYTDIDYIGFGWRKDNTATSAREFYMANFATDATPTTIIYGGPDAPITGRRIADALVQGGRTTRRSYSQGLAQDILTTSIQLGDGTTETHYKAQASSIEYPGLDLYDYLVEDNNLDFIVKGSANCVFDFGQATNASTTVQGFTIDAASSTSASYLFAAAIFKNKAITWKTGITCDGATFIECPEIDAKGGTFDNCTNLMTRAGASEAAFAFDTNSTMTGTEIDLTATSAGYHIELGTAVTAFTLTDVTFTGTPGTDKIHVLRTTGTVTITTAGTTSLVAGDITSAGATVNIVSSPVAVTVTVLDESDTAIKGASVRLETASETVIDDETNASGVATANYSGTTPVAISFAKVAMSSGATPYQAQEIAGTITSSGFSTTVKLIED